MEHLQAALRATNMNGPAAEQITTIGRQLGYFGYLTHDALVWVRPLSYSVPSSGVINLTTLDTGKLSQVLELCPKHRCTHRKARQPVLARRHCLQHHLWSAQGAC